MTSTTTPSLPPRPAISPAAASPPDAGEAWRQAIPRAQEMIRAVTMGALATPEDRLERAERVAAVLGPRLANPPYSRPGRRGKAITITGWTLAGHLAGYVFGSPVGPVVTLTDHMVVNGNVRGFRAVCEARTAEGQLLATAEHECTDKEEHWRDEDRYALRSMAETRAAVKALRFALGWIVALCGEQFELTPAEELPANDTEVPEA